MKNLKANREGRGAHLYFEWDQMNDAAKAIAQQYHIQRTMLIMMGHPCPDVPVIIIGHSWGGGNSQYLSDLLAGYGVPVDWLVTLDPVGALPMSKSDNVKNWVNAHSAMDYVDYIWPLSSIGMLFLAGASAALGAAGVDGTGPVTNEGIATAGGQLGAEDGATNVEVTNPSGSGTGLDHGDANGYLNGALAGSPALQAAIVGTGIIR